MAEVRLANCAESLMPILPMRAHRTFDADARSVAGARRFAREKLAEWDAPDLVENATLLVSELVTNAVVHTGTSARLDLRLDGRSLRVEVEDRHPSRALPTGIPEPSEDAESGRGILITSFLASSWGVEYTPTSKRVWVVCDREMGPVRYADQAPAGDATAGNDVHVAAVSMSADGVVTAWNADAALLFGWSSDEAVGRPFEEMVDHAPGQRPPTGFPVAGPSGWQGSYMVLCKDGSFAPVFASHLPPGRNGGSVALVVHERQRALLEHPFAAPRPARSESDPLGLRDDALRRLGVDDYLTLAVERARELVAADAAYLLLAQDVDDDFEVVAVSGFPDELRGSRVDRGAAGAPDARHPHLPVVLPDISDLDVILLAGTGLRSLVIVPVVVEGRLIGALAAGSERVHGFTDAQSALLQRLADSLAVAADRARLQAAERERRGWLSFLAEAGDLLAGSLDQNMTMAITGQIVVPRIATWCAVHLDDERGQPVLQQVWHADEHLVEPLRAALVATSPDQIGDSDEALVGESVTTIRLVARGHQIGFLTLGRSKGDPLRSEVFIVAESIARRAALAIDNARAHGDLQAVGQALQQSLLPSSMPATPGLDVGVIYEAAGEGSAAGGDFYDLFLVGNGTWCFVVGDVCGTGAEAAAVTGLARHTIRALARVGLPMAAVLERLNAAILDEGERSRFLTLVCGTLKPVGRSVHISLVNAGHPPPFVVEQDGKVRQVGTPQSLLGVLDNVAYTAEEHVLERGDLLVMVTDGVLERRDDHHMLGEEGLSAELAQTSRLPAQAVAERISRLVVDFTDEPPRDDMAILAIRVEAGSR